LSCNTQINNAILQLGNHGVLEQHGFARNRFWSVDESPPPFPVATSNCHVDLILKSSQEDLKIWPHRSPSSQSLNHLYLIKKCHYIHQESPLIQSCSLPMPCSYEFRLRVALSPRGDLILTSRIKNISSDSKPFQFTFAYHTYFSVSDIRYLVKCHLFALCLHQVFLTLFECKGA